MKRVVITGATSMIGIATIEELLKEKDIERIYAIVRPDTLNISRIPIDNRISIVESSISQYTHLSEKIINGCDTFYHMAWERTSTYEEDVEEIKRKCYNTIGVIDALKCAKELDCQKFILTGSQSEFGLSNERLTPSTQCNPVRSDGIARYSAGKMGSIIAEQYGMAFIWVRVFSIYGKYDRDNSLISSTIKKLKNGEHCSFTLSEQMWDYLNAEDAGRAFCQIGKKIDCSKVYCLGSGEEYPLRYYIETIRDVVDINAELGFGEIPYPRNPVMRLCADISDLTNDTGWLPEIGFREGIVRLAGIYG